MNHLMIDWETWGIAKNSVVRALVMIYFSEHETGNMLYIDARKSVDDQLEHCRQISKKTQDWWTSQSPTLSEMIAASENRIIECLSIQEICESIIDFYSHHKPEFIWSRRSMDHQIINDLLSIHGMSTPWRYHNEYDCSSFDVLTPKPHSIRPHDPFFDCISQIQHVQAAIKMTPSIDN